MDIDMKAKDEIDEKGNLGHNSSGRDRDRERDRDFERDKDRDRDRDRDRDTRRDRDKDRDRDHRRESGRFPHFVNEILSDRLILAQVALEGLEVEGAITGNRRKGATMVTYVPVVSHAT